MVERLGEKRIRATGQGRFVLNAVVAKLSQGFEGVPPAKTYAGVV
jgi:hypothetical protein